jgi:hypothetical protein
MSGQQHAPAVLYPQERPGTHCTRGWVGPRAGLDGRKISPHQDSTSDRPGRSQSMYRLSYPVQAFARLSIPVANISVSPWPYVSPSIVLNCLNLLCRQSNQHLMHYLSYTKSPTLNALSFIHQVTNTYCTIFHTRKHQHLKHYLSYTKSPTLNALSFIHQVTNT